MTAHASTSVTPHRLDVDLTRLDGYQVLGEPVALLFSAMLRLRINPQGDGMATLSGTLPDHEMDAIRRAMARSERKIPGDRRTSGQRDCDRLLAVCERVSGVCQAVLNGAHA